MDIRTIFSKTGKGSLEITKKSIKLSSDERQALILVDGKSSLAQLEEKLNRLPPLRLRAIFEKLREFDLIREFITQGGPESIMPTPGSAAAAIRVQEITEDDLDFTAFASVIPSIASKEAEQHKQEAAAAAARASELEAKRKAEIVARAQAERKARDDALLREQARMAEEAKRKAREEAERIAKEAAARLGLEAAERKAREEAERIAKEAAARLARETAERKAREEAERIAKEAAARLARETAERKAREEAERIAKEAAARLAREAAERKAREEAERIAKEEAARLAREAAERQAREEAERIAKEEAARLAREAAERKAREEAERIAKEAAARLAREAAERKTREEAERIAKEAAARLARETAERKAREEAERIAKEEAARLARETADRKAREEAERIAKEAAARLARETADRKAREEAERIAKEAAARLAREADERKAREEAERKAREDAERIAREEAARLAREEASRKAREQAEREVRAHAEAHERARIEEEAKQRIELAQRQAREEAERDAREQTAARERARQEEEAVRREIAERQLQEEEARRKAAEEARHRQLEAEETRQRLRAEQERLAAQARDEQKRAEVEALRYTAALAPHLQAAAATVDPVSAASAAPAPMGAFSNLASLESGTPEAPANTDDPLLPAAENAGVRTEQEKATRKQLDKEAKARAKEQALASKQAEKEAKQLARANRAGVLGGASIGVGKIIAAILILTIGGALAYIFNLSADKPAIEKMLSARFATTVTVGQAKFTPFPAELRLTDMMLGDIKLPLVVASADPASLASNDKIWRNVDVTGLQLNPAQVEKLAALASMDPGRGAMLSFSLQRVRALGVSITGTPVAVPKFDATLLVGSNGALKQATLALPDGRAQILLASDEKGWLVDFESRGVEWPLGPKAPWESLRGKGIATRGGIKVDEFTMTLAGGVARGSGELAWTNGWKYTGTVDISGIDAEAISTSIYGTAPISGPFEGKLDVSLAATSLNRLFATPQLDGNFTMTKVVFKTVDFARLLQGNDPAGGQTRLPELTGTLSASGGRLQLRQLRGSSGLLTLSGGLDVSPEKALGGTVTVELGAAGSRGRSSLRVSGTLAEPRFGR